MTTTTQPIPVHYATSGKDRLIGICHTSAGDYSPPLTLLVAIDPAAVTCQDCLAWIEDFERRTA